MLSATPIGLGGDDGERHAKTASSCDPTSASSILLLFDEKLRLQLLLDEQNESELFPKDSEEDDDVGLVQQLLPLRCLADVVVLLFMILRRMEFVKFCDKEHNESTLFSSNCFFGSSPKRSSSFSSASSPPCCSVV